MVKNNKTCILCGKVYSYCSNCAEFDHLPRWMECYCSENCRDIFNALSAYNMKTKSKTDIINILNSCNIESDKYCKFNQDCINEIMKKDTFEKSELIQKEIMNAPAEDKPIKNSVNDSESISDPIMGTVKQSKRMKYTNKNK